MAYILNQAYVNAQLAVVGISPTDLASAPFDSKVQALMAVANASVAASGQIALTKELSLADKSIAVGDATMVVCKLQATQLRKELGIPEPVDPPAVA